MTRKVQSKRPNARNKLPTGNDVPSNSARVAALRMLARRELSEFQVRQRLARRGYTESDIHATIDRLKSERAIDDFRVAGAIARTETWLKHRGRRRVGQRIAQAGIAAAVAKRAIEETLVDCDGDQLIDAALSKRLRGGRTIADEKEFLRLYRYLIAQGFDSDRALAALSKRRGDKAPAPEA